MAALIWKNLNPPMIAMNAITMLNIRIIRFVMCEPLSPFAVCRRYGRGKRRFRLEVSRLYRSRAPRNVETLVRHRLSHKQSHSRRFSSTAATELDGSEA